MDLLFLIDNKDPMKAWADVITLTYLATDEKSNRNSSLLIPCFTEQLH